MDDQGRRRRLSALCEQLDCWSDGGKAVTGLQKEVRERFEASRLLSLAQRPPLRRPWLLGEFNLARYLAWDRGVEDAACDGAFSAWDDTSPPDGLQMP